LHFTRKHKAIAGGTLLAVALLFILLMPRPNPDPFRADAVVNPPFTSLTYGIQTFLWWDETAAGLHTAWVRLMNFSHVKQIFAWEDVEPQPGDWHFERADKMMDTIQEHGLKVVARLGNSPSWAHPGLTGDRAKGLDVPPDADHTDEWARFCGTLAERYKGRIVAYQIWNEPNLAREWGNKPPDAASYVALLRSCSEAIRAADPKAILISAGLAPTGTYSPDAMPDDLYLQAMYDAKFQQYVDVVGVNAPGYNSPPDLSPDEAVAKGGQRYFTFRHVEDMRKIMVANGDAARQMAILEFGWTTDPIHPAYKWFAVDEQTQAKYMVGAYQYAKDHWRPWMGLMSAIYIADTTWTKDREEYWWAITTPDIARPAFFALANMAKYCGDRIIPERDPGSPEALGLVTTVPCS
jgi:hypothetical protein